MRLGELPGCSLSFLPSLLGVGLAKLGGKRRKVISIYRHCPESSHSPTGGLRTANLSHALLPSLWILSPSPSHAASAAPHGTKAELATDWKHRHHCPHDTFQRRRGMQALVTKLCRIWLCFEETNKPLAIFYFERMPFYRRKKTTYCVFRNLILSIC